MCVGVSLSVCARNWCCLLPFENFVSLVDCTIECECVGVSVCVCERVC